MNSSITKLHSLLQRLQGKDLAQMAQDEIDDLRSKATMDFVAATAGLNEVLLGNFSNSPRWLWSAKEAQHFGGNWIATFDMVDTGQMETAIGKPKLIQLAAAMFQRMRLNVDVFAEYHHPGGTGRQVEPSLLITLWVVGDPMSELVGLSLQKSKSLYPEHGSGITIVIQPAENCCAGFTNPNDATSAFSQVAKAARDKSIRKNGHPDLSEAVKISVEMDASVDAEKMTDVFQFMGLLFAIPIVSYTP
jgi:hypothetical protein